MFCIPPPPARDSSCRDSKAPLKVASYGNTEVIIFHCCTSVSQPGRSEPREQRAEAAVAVTLGVSELAGRGPRRSGVGVQYLCSPYVYLPPVSGCAAGLSERRAKVNLDVCKHATAPAVIKSRAEELEDSGAL